MPGAKFDLQAPFSARRRPAPRHRRADRRPRARRPLPDAPRRHRVRQDDDHRQRHPEHRQADARPLAQQDARRAALRRAQVVLPEQRRRVLHLVLRLLPARSVRPVERHVHREGRVDQRRHRPAAPARDVIAHGARRRHHRRDGLGDLRPRRSGHVSRDDGHAERRPEDQARRHPALAREDPVLAQRRRVRARHVPRARRHGRDLPGVRGAGRAHRDVRRRDREDLQGQSAHRRDDREPREGGRLSRPSTSSPRGRRSSRPSR